MMTKKKRTTILITIIVIILIIIGIIIALLYLKTDMFKSNKQLFVKYLAKNFENMDSTVTYITQNDYKKALNESKYTTNSQVKINYTKDIGTSLENTQNAINKLKLSIDGQTDNINNYAYRDIKLLNDNEQQMEIELLKQDNTYGIRFSDLFIQYILVENTNLKELFTNAGYTDEEVENIPNEIQINSQIQNIQFTTKEKEQLQEKYIGIFNEKISNEKFSKQTNQNITINNTNLTVNLYTLTLTKEELNNLYIQILENLKQDEIILNKIDILGNMLNQNTLKEEFIQSIEEEIGNINRNNIGQDQTKIIVCESEGNTVSTQIITNEYEMNLDWSQNGDEKYLQIANSDKTSSEEKIDSIELKLTKEKIDLVARQKNGQDENVLTINNTIGAISNNQFTNNFIVKYELAQSRLEMNVETTIETVGNFENTIELNEENSIKLNDLNDEQLKQILNTVNEGWAKKGEELSQKINVQDLNDILKDIGLIKEETVIEETGVSETEKNRFNAQFELLQGENLDSDRIFNLIEAIKNNFVNIEVVSNKELKLELDENNKNEEMSDKLTALIEANKNKKYNVTIEYDEQTGLAKYIVLTIATEE